MKPLSIEQVVRFLRQTFFIGLTLSLLVYIWVRLLLFEAPLQFSEEAVNLLKVVTTGWVMIMLLKGTFYVMLAIGNYLPRVIARNKAIGPLLLFLFTGGVLLLCMW